VTIVVRVFIRVSNVHIHYILIVSHGGVVVTVVARYVIRPMFDPGYSDETNIIYLLTTEIEIT
jgi:hypothetical protein